MNTTSSNLPFYLVPEWLTQDTVQSLWSQLWTLPWQDEYLTLFGRSHRMPRQVLWVADAELNYRYAHQDHLPHPWPDSLTFLRERLKQTLAVDFNGVLCNLYHHGQDYMGWHSDDESSIDPKYPIASLSLGAERRFKCRSKDDHKNVINMRLPSGSLFIMQPGMQAKWQHMLPKMRTLSEPRINLTFRVMQQKDR